MLLSHLSHYGQFENLTHPVGNPYKLSAQVNFVPRYAGGGYVGGKSERMMIMASITKNILKKLAALYGSAFHDGNWHIALQVAERQGKNGGMFEKPHLSEVTRITDMRERQDLIDARERLDPELTHPPPPGQV